MYIKFTKRNGITHGDFHWPLPTKNADGTWTPGDWTPEIKGDIEQCSRGYHFTDEEWCAGWIDEEIYEVEISGEIVWNLEEPIKYVCHRARLLRKFEGWNSKTQRLFAVRCARDVMRLISNDVDPRSLEAIKVAEKYANGKALQAELRAAGASARSVANAHGNRGTLLFYISTAAHYTTDDDACFAAWHTARYAANGYELTNIHTFSWRDMLKKYSKWLMKSVEKGEQHG